MSISSLLPYRALQKRTLFFFFSRLGLDRDGLISPVFSWPRTPSWLILTGVGEMAGESTDLRASQGQVGRHLPSSLETGETAAFSPILDTASKYALPAMFMAVMRRQTAISIWRIDLLHTNLIQYYLWHCTCYRLLIALSQVYQVPQRRVEVLHNILWRIKMKIGLITRVSVWFPRSRVFAIGQTITACKHDFFDVCSRQYC